MWLFKFNAGVVLLLPTKIKTKIVKKWFMVTEINLNIKYNYMKNVNIKKWNVALETIQNIFKTKILN